MISKSLSTSERFAGLVQLAGPLAEFCHALYPLMVAHADDFGRIQGDVFTVKAVCYPASERSLKDFTAGLEHMHSAGLIAWYAVAGKRYVQIANFDPHQQGLHKRTRSRFPEVPGSNDEVPTLPSEENRREQNSRELKNVSPKPQRGSVPTTASPILLEFPVVGKGGPVWQLSEAKVAEWAGLYPSLSIIDECRKALAWIRSDPGRRKTIVGMERFLVGWFNRANDHGGRTTARVAQARHGPVDASTEEWVQRVGYCGHKPRCEPAGHGQCLERFIRDKAQKVSA